MIFDTVVISDTHLGAKNCAVNKLRTFLNNIRTKMLILNGDIFDDLNFKRLDGPHFHCLRIIRKLSRRIKVIWIAGNHDGAAEVLSHIMGIPVKTDVVLDVNGKKYCVLHGDVFDNILSKYPFLVIFVEYIYRFLQILIRKKNIFVFLTKRSKAINKSYERVKRGCIEIAKKKGFHGILAGHLHIPESDHTNGIHYINSGSWTQDKCTFIGIKGSTVQLYDYDEFYQSLKEHTVSEPESDLSFSKKKPKKMKEYALV